MENLFSFDKINLLPNHLKAEENDFVDFLLLKETKKTTKNESIRSFSGILTDQEGEEILNIINDSCGKIDLNEWK